MCSIEILRSRLRTPRALTCAPSGRICYVKAVVCILHHIPLHTAVHRNHSKNSHGEFSVLKARPEIASCVKMKAPPKRTR